MQIVTQVEDRQIIAALHAEGHERIKRFILALLRYEDDPILLEDCADLVLGELERRAGPPG